MGLEVPDCLKPKPKVPGTPGVWTRRNESGPRHDAVMQPARRIQKREPDASVCTVHVLLGPDDAATVVVPEGTSCRSGPDSPEAHSEDGCTDRAAHSERVADSKSPIAPYAASVLHRLASTRAARQSPTPRIHPWDTMC
eukprot:3349980-Rhodomonas_salina.1